MNDTMEPTKSIYKILIHAPIDKVWSELVRTNSPRPFFFGSVCKTPGAELNVGAPFRMESPNGKYASVVGEVLEFQPPHRYAHTFKFTNLEDPPCRVTYELKEVAGGTEFTLISEGFVPGSKTQKSMESGGKFIAENFKAYMETGRATFGGRMILGMISLMTPFSPAKCKIENWPFGKTGTEK